ncbi:glycosyltransferase 87 family protein [Plantactinospora siamensis]|uniref:Glycosyltransferase 87 family protein n=1 Tax=Plantactinospora siamensis TaxID=555372 RepID=A0ABV6P196_9ACTN
MSRSGTARRVAVLAGAVTATALFLAYVPAHRGWFDVGVYHGAVSSWLRDGGALYDYVRPGTHYGFTYPPFAALVLSPLALLAWHPAVAASVLVNAGAAALVLHWLLAPVARRAGWRRWYAFGLAGCAFAVLEPVRDTVSFGQVNLVLLALVLADWRALGRVSKPLAGVGIGLAAAIKLTPAVFIGYLLVSRQWRAAAAATGTALGATLLAMAVAPGTSRVFWTEALWDTGRVGDLAYVSNQSLRGVLARIGPDLPATLWLVAVLAVLALWAGRVRRATAVGDRFGGFALTGVLGCLISPVTWVHHLVWLIPALARLADAARCAEPRGRRRALLAAAGASYLILCSSLVWLWWNGAHGIVGFLGANAYVWLALALLAGLPLGDRAGRALGDRTGRALGDRTGLPRGGLAGAQAGQVQQGQPVAVHAQPADHPGRHG